MNERQNIRRFQMPERQDDNPLFDVRRDITKADWNNSATILRSLLEGVVIDESAALASRLHVLAPLGDVLLNTEQRNELQERVASAATNENWEEFLERGAAMRLLRPQDDIYSRPYSYRELRAPRADNVRTKVHAMLDKNRREGFREEFCIQSFYASIVDPDFDWRFPPGELTDILGGLRIDEYAQNSIANPALARAGLHVLYPGLEQTTAKEWQAMRKALEHRRPVAEWSCLDFWNIALAMKILSTDRVQFTKERGLEFLMVPDHREKPGSPPASLDLQQL